MNGKTQKRKTTNQERTKEETTAIERTNKKHQLKKDNTDKKHLLNSLFQGGLMATYWLVGRKEEERDD